jgi:plastocyanin
MNEKRQTQNVVSRRSFLKLIAVALGTSAGSPLIAACTPKNQEQFQVDIVLEQSKIHYSPATLKIPQGATVTWLNKSYYSQSATCDPNQSSDNSVVNLPKGAQPWDSGILYPGQRFSKTFDTPGTYVYFSQPKLSLNTVGTIIVG